MMMCDKELLVGFLYDELSDSEREEFARHLESCGVCRDEADGLRATRAQLALWRPPEPDLGFEMIRRAPAPARSRFAVSPAWGLAAAAVLVLALASAIANLEIRGGRDGFVVRTGWNQPADQVAAGAPAAASESTAAEGRALPAASAQPAIGEADLRAIVERLSDLETQVSSQRGGPAAGVTAVSADAAAATGRLTDAEILRRVRDIVADSEKRQQTALAGRVVQAMRELEAAYRTELVRLQQGITQNQGMRDAEVYRQREMLNQVYRLVGQQR